MTYLDELLSDLLPPPPQLPLERIDPSHPAHHPIEERPVERYARIERVIHCLDLARQLEEVSGERRREERERSGVGT